MIQDNQTNTLFLADTLAEKYPGFYSHFTNILHHSKVDYRLIPNTRDVWAVDYMPIQVNDNKFVQFAYTPDYLMPKLWRKTITDTDEICRRLGIETLKSDIVLDGGNVVKYSNTVIMCDKVFRENKQYSERTIIDTLQLLLEVDRIIFVPQDKHDFTGHADGMVRFLDSDTVLINDLSGESVHYQSAFRMSLHNAGLHYVEVPFCPDNVHAHSAHGLYINYLEMNGIIFLPVFGIKEDERVVRQIEQLFTDYTIHTVASNPIAAQGGVLNCISWNIKI